VNVDDEGWAIMKGEAVFVYEGRIAI